MIFRETDFDVFTEDFVTTQTNQATNKKEKIRLENFASVANFCPGPVNLMKLYVENKVSWPTYKYTADEKYITLPNDIIKNKIADCLDSAIFARTFCNFRKIQNNIIFISVVNRKTNELMTGHAVLAYKGNKIKEWFIWNYEFNGYGTINGPFNTLESAALEFSGYYLVSHSNMGIKDGYSNVAKQKLAAALEPDELKMIDKMVENNAKYTQSQLLSNFRTISDLNLELLNIVNPVLEQSNGPLIRDKSANRLFFKIKPNSKEISRKIIKMAINNNSLRFEFDAKNANRKAAYEF